MIQLDLILCYVRRSLCLYGFVCRHPCLSMLKSLLGNHLIFGLSHLPILLSWLICLASDLVLGSLDYTVLYIFSTLLLQCLFLRQKNQKNLSTVIFLRFCWTFGHTWVWRGWSLCIWCYWIGQPTSWGNHSYHHLHGISAQSGSAGPTSNGEHWWLWVRELWPCWRWFQFDPWQQRPPNVFWSFQVIFVWLGNRTLHEDLLACSIHKTKLNEWGTQMVSLGMRGYGAGTIWLRSWTFHVRVHRSSWNLPTSEQRWCQGSGLVRKFLRWNPTVLISRSLKNISWRSL